MIRKMRKEFNFLIFLLFFCAQSSLYLDLRASRIRESSSWISITIKADGGQGPYQFSYTQLPLNWKQHENSIYISKIYPLIESSFLCRVIVTDAANNTIKQSIIFKSRKNRLFISDVKYDFNLPFSAVSSDQEHAFMKNSFQQTIEERKRIQEKLKELQPVSDTSDEAVLEKVKEVIATVKSHTVNHTLEMDDIFKKVPNFSEIDQIVESGDNLGISKAVQEVIMSKMPCQEKLTYLSYIFSSIEKVVEKRNISIKKLSVLKELSNEEIERMRNEIIILEEGQKSLNISNFQNNLKMQILRLEEAYKLYNRIVSDSQKSKKMLEKNTFNVQLKKVASVIEKRKQQIFQKQSELSRAEQEYQQLKQKLQISARKRQKVKEQTLIEKQDLQRLFSQKKQIKNQALKAQILQRESPELLLKLKVNCLKIEIEVRRKRTDLSEARKKLLKIEKQKIQIEKRIQKERNKINSETLQDVKEKLDLLKSNLPKVQSQIYQMHYQCYNTFASQQGSKYLLKPSEYVSYIEKVYQIPFPSDLITTKKQITLTPISIYSDGWIEKYGQNISETTFQCISEGAESMRGQIRQIVKNKMVVVGFDGLVYTLILEKCTRIESVRNETPEIGENILWKGHIAGKQKYYVNLVSCF